MESWELALLMVVLAMAAISGGAKLSIEIGGVTFQFSELVKITFVFFVAGMLREDTSFKRVVVTTIVAAAHVLILVVSKDLGSAVVFFVAYIVMLYVATKKARYALAGLAGGAVAAVAAYFLFNHVRQRVIVWQDPIAVYDKVGGGYQVAQGLFGISAGGWFGMGLGKGMPNIIPVVDKDFIFAAICEELGAIFAICMLLVCMSCYLMIVNVSMRMSKPFYKLIAMGLGAEYAFQVFLTVGGTSKFIPMTGITLPLVSYGGSSVICTILMFAIIQGLYILRERQKVKNLKEREKRNVKNQRNHQNRTRLEEMEFQEDLDTGRKHSKKKFRSKQKKASTGKEYTIIAYCFVGIFLALIGYLVYFNVELRDEYANSPYNSKRQGTYQERVTKGKILASDGDILASTEKDSEGNEYRQYPYKNVFAHVVGYSDKGTSGLEQVMNSQLLTSMPMWRNRCRKSFRMRKMSGIMSIRHWIQSCSRQRTMRSAIERVRLW